jgi:hypothetical protein
MAYGHAERNLALLRQLEAETRQLLESLDLKERAGDPQAGHLHRGDGRRGPGESLRPYLAVLGKVAHVGEEGADIDHIAKAGTMSSQNRRDVVHDEIRLGGHVAAADDLAVRVNGDLAG